MPKHRKSRGGGFTTQLSNMINPGNPVFQQYDGAGKDCAGEVVRPGYMDMYSSKGLPGLSGGRRHSRRQRHSGGTALVPAYVENYGVSAPGVVPITAPAPAPDAPTPDAPAPAQKGGRYEVTPGFYNSAAIGASSYAPIGRIPCEASATAVPTRGGKRSSRRRRTRGKTRGGVNMGEVGSMAYNAPTAGYRNDFQAFPSGGAVPGLMLQVPYDARAGNPACGTTGGKRSKRRVRFNGGSLADNAAPVAALTVDQVQTRADFDGSNKGLPVKFGGARRSKRGSKRSKRSGSKRSKRSKRGRRSCFSLKKLFHL